jgi:hypothetical protein
LAWSDPRTWVDSEFVTASIMNQHVRDNLNVAGPHLIVRKASDGAPVTTSTLTNDADLLMAVAANEVWHFRFCALLVSSSGNYRIAMSFPSGGVTRGTQYGGAGTGQVDSAQWSSATSPAGNNLQYIGAADGVMQIAEGVYVNGGTAGNITLQTRCETTGNLVTKANSTLWAVRLA